MNSLKLLTLVFFIIGISFFAFGILNEEIEIGVFFIFPFLIGTGIYILLGFISIFIAIILFILVFISNFYHDDLRFRNNNLNKTYKKTSVKSGGIILIGPIPIIFGSNWKIAFIMMMFAIIIIISFFILRQL
jgi:uncharacterized protein (TIGR00304 family)